MYIEYSTAFHMKFKHLFVDYVYDDGQVAKAPFIITWAESHMCMEDGKCLAVAAKTAQYEDSFKVTEEFFTDALQSYFLFPNTHVDDKDSSKLRLEFVKALLNS